MVNWKDETVSDHSSGITDLISSSPSDFQQECLNLPYNDKLKHLSSRDGYRRFTSQQTPTKIQQLFKLEDWIIAYCYNDPVDDDDQVSGVLYYRLESDTTSAWTLVQTPKERTTATIFRIYNSAGKGFTLRKTSPTFDNWVVKDGTDAGTDPDVSYSGRTVTLTVDSAALDSDLKYNTGSGFLKFSWFTTAFAGGWTCTLLSGTAGTDDVVFDGMLTVEMVASALLGIYPASARSDGDGTALAFIDEQGHLQPSDWQSHLYMALEPYLKTYTANPSDPYGKDPDTYPPDNNRLPLRKIAPFATPVGQSPAGYELKAINAQLPKTFIGIDLTMSEPDDYTNSIKDFRYQVWTLRWDYESPTYLGDETATIEIYCERTWGQVGSVGTMPSGSYLRYETFDAKDPIDDTMPFALADYNVAAVSPYSGISGGIDWGKLFLVFHQRDPANVQFTTLSYQATVEAIQAAFEEYQKRFVDIGGTDYYSAHQKFGFYIKVNPKAKVDEQLHLTDCFLSVRYTDNLPEDVAGNHQYGYAFYMRDSYEGAFEGSPREFVFDGPAAFLQVRTLSEIGLEPLIAYTDAAKATAVRFSTSPLIYGGVAARMLRSTDLYYQSNMVGVFARTLSQGDVYYIDEEAKFWYRSADLSVPTIPQGLVDEDWLVLTSYVIPHQSETNDVDEQFNEQAYFNGGVLSYDSLPQGPYFFGIVNQIGYYANIVNNIQRLYQSAPGVPHASPATLFDDFDDELTGWTQFLDKPIVGTQNKIVRVEGSRAADGSGRTFLRVVSDEFGCISNQSMVLTNIGVFLWSNTGIIYTDGLRALRVSEHLMDRYPEWLSTVRNGLPTIGPKQLRGSYDGLNRLVFWSLYDEDGQPFYVVLSLKNGISEMMPIHVQRGTRVREVNSTTGAVTARDYFLTHATLYSKDYQRFYRGQERYLMVSDPDRAYDESHNTAFKHPIDFLYKSVGFDYGLPTTVKLSRKITFSLRDLTKTGVSLQPLHWNELAEEGHEMSNCLSFQHLDWVLDYASSDPLDLEQFWKHNNCRWKSETLVNYKRYFGKGLQRNCYKQVGFKEMKLKYAEISMDTSGIAALQVTYKSDDFPLATAIIQIQSTGSIATFMDAYDLDLSGQFYVAWEPTQKPVQVGNIEFPGGNVCRITVLLDDDIISSDDDYIQLRPTISLYRKFTDQRIELLAYTVKYRLIGDRTQGLTKSVSKGGFDAG